MNRLFRLTWFPLAFQLLTLGAVALSLLVVRKLIAAHVRKSGWRAAPLYHQEKVSDPLN